MSVDSRTPFSKILIANRGEIALRVMRSARALGYETVAVYSTADAAALHMKTADQAVCIGAPPPSDSYLNIGAIIDAAKLTGADAVHPGYGFLAENAAFARACRDAGLVFIGPSPEAIVAMGDKAGAKALMRAAGVPCIAGYQGDDQGEARLADEAERIGFPVMIKATAGGGGRGMRLVDSAADFVEALRGARSEARGAFGNDQVILERAIATPRHIEIQIVADRYGNVVHLGERDCSVQRRHQKLIEESPSPAVDAALRERMGATAVAAVKAISYEGVGTLEFLLDAHGDFHFMEMNTRLQVEHPVTEAVTGLDLVALQLRIAAGEPLPITQEQVRFEGHAIEVRLCAEDAHDHFMPQSGTMAVWRVAPRLRVEHAMFDGADIPPYYDSMIAKLIAHGPTREEARRKLIVGLDETVALGVETNQSFLQRCLSHVTFAEGHATTAFIGQHLNELSVTDKTSRTRAIAVAAVWLQEVGRASTQPATRRRMTHNLPIKRRLVVGDVRCEASIVIEQPDRFIVTLTEARSDDRTVTIDLRSIGESSMRFVCDGVDESASFHRDGRTLLLAYRGEPIRIEDTSLAASVRPADAMGDGRVRASMNGRVVSVWVAVGDSVRASQPLFTLEAMKMEHVHVAPVAGKVAAIHVATGDQVAANRIVAEIEITPTGTSQ